jgi:hypothetical protein
MQECKRCEMQCQKCEKKKERKFVHAYE